MPISLTPVEENMLLQEELSWRRQEDILESRKTAKEIRNAEKGSYLFLKTKHPSSLPPLNSSIY